MTRQHRTARAMLVLGLGLLAGGVLLVSGPAERHAPAQARKESPGPKSGEIQFLETEAIEAEKAKTDTRAAQDRAVEARDEALKKQEEAARKYEEARRTDPAQRTVPLKQLREDLEDATRVLKERKDDLTKKTDAATAALKRAQRVQTELTARRPPPDRPPAAIPTPNPLVGINHPLGKSPTLEFLKELDAITKGKPVLPPVPGWNPKAPLGAQPEYGHEPVEVLLNELKDKWEAGSGRKGSLPPLVEPRDGPGPSPAVHAIVGKWAAVGLRTPETWTFEQGGRCTSTNLSGTGTWTSSGPDSVAATMTYTLTTPAGTSTMTCSLQISIRGSEGTMEVRCRAPGVRIYVDKSSFPIRKQ